MQILVQELPDFMQDESSERFGVGDITDLD
jgi:hypothetical protein